MKLIKQFYIFALHKIKYVLLKLNLLPLIEGSENRFVKWFRSLFAIYDLNDLVHLDLPWWTFEAVDFLDEHLKKQSHTRVFEWGSGASTVWLAKRCSEVITIEHDIDWADQVKTLTTPLSNTNLIVIPPQKSGRISSQKQGFEDLYFDDYVESINNTEGKFDLIIIDGRAREACLEIAQKKLSPTGYILVDDTKRKRYIAAISKVDLQRKSFRGLAVALPLPDATDILSLY